MRSVLFTTVFALLLPTYADAQSSSEGLSCFANLGTPEYPTAALQAHVDGSVWTTTHVSPQGTIDKIDTQVVSAWGEGSKLLTPPVEKALRAAKIRSECAGKAVSVVFRYQLHGEATENPEVKSHREEPNLLWIESEPSSVTETATARKSPAKSPR